MTPDEQKAWEELVEKCHFVPETYPNRFHPVVLAADAELKRLREVAEKASRHRITAMLALHDVQEIIYAKLMDEVAETDAALQAAIAKWKEG